MPVVTRIESPPPEPFCEYEDGAEAKGAGYRFIAPRTATEPLVFRAADGATFLWTPTELVYGDADGHLDYIAGSAPASFTVRGRSVHYPRTFPASEEVHVALPEGRKYWLYLYEPPRLPGAHLSGDMWFGVSGMVGGIPLPSGRHQAMESFGFQFQPVYAEDTMGTRVEGWYEVVDTDQGQQLFICVPADWLLDPDRVYPVKIDPTVVVGVSYPTIPGSVSLIARLNTALVVAYQSSSSSFRFLHSRDNGQTWLDTGISVSAENLAMVADEDGAAIHIALKRGTSTYRYRRMVPSGDSYAISPEVSLDIGKMTDYWGNPAQAWFDGPNLVVHREGDGWLAHIFFRKLRLWREDYSNYTVSVVYNRVSISSTGQLSNVASDEQIGFMSDGPPKRNADCPVAVVLDPSTQTIHVWWIGYRSGEAYYSRLVRSGNAWVIQKINNFNYISAGFYGGSNSTCYWSQGRCFNGIPYVACNFNRTLYLSWFDPVQNACVAVSLGGLNLQAADTVNLGMDKDGVLYLYYPARDASGNLIGLYVRTYFNDAWGDPVLIDPAGMAPNLAAGAINEDRIECVYSVENAGIFDVIYNPWSFNQPPLAPSNLVRAPFDASDDALFTWQHNDTDPGDGQSAYHLQIRLAWADTDLVDTGEVQSPISEYLLPGGTLENGRTYQWRVRTADQAGEWSPWSDYAVFQTGPKPIATILFPTAGATVSTSEVTVEWSVSNQSAATVRLYDGAGQTVLQEHEVTTPSARAKTITSLENNQQYQVSVQVTSAIGVQGDEVFSGVFNVQYTPPPKPTATATPQEGFVRISIVNPPPTGDQPDVASNEVWRREPGKDWVRVAAGIAPDGTYDDYATASGVIYEYRVRAIGANGTYSDSDVVAASLTITGGIWLHDPRDPENTAHHFMYHELPSSDHPLIPSGKFQFAGRKLPVVQMDASQMERIVRYRLYLSDETDDRAALEALYERRTTLCLRNHRGKKYYVVFTEMPLEFERRGAWADVEFQVVDYKEEV